MQRFSVLFYEQSNGHKPAELFLLSLDLKMRVKLAGLIQILQEKGSLVREPYSKSLGDGIFELRCKVGNDISRILYFFYDGGEIILTNGFIKKSQKIPVNELLRAKQYRADFLERSKDENI